MLEKVIKLHTHVWRVRAEIDHTWRTPPPMDCVRYAVTEAGEAMDAWLRSTRPGDARNHAGGADVLAELGDCAIMLASALETPPTTHYPVVNETDLDFCVLAVARIMETHSSNFHHQVEWALACVFAYPGFSLDIALGRLERILEKHRKPNYELTRWQSRPFWSCVVSPPATRPSPSRSASWSPNTLNMT